MRVAFLVGTITALALGSMWASRNPVRQLGSAPQQISINRRQEAPRTSGNAHDRNQQSQWPIPSAPSNQTVAERQAKYDTNKPTGSANTSGDNSSSVANRISAAAFVVAFFAMIASGVSAYLTRKTMILGQRAYVTVKHLTNVTPPLVPGQAVDIRLAPIWLNSGNTPAYAVNYYTCADWLTETEQTNYAFPIPSGHEARTVIGPDGEEQGPHTGGISAAGMMYAESQRKALVLYGAVNYTDIFGYSHRTEFCYRAMHEPSVNKLWPPAFQKQACHNGADEDCMRDPYAKPGSPPRAGTEAV